MLGFGGTNWVSELAKEVGAKRSSQAVIKSVVSRNLNHSLAMDEQELDATEDINVIAALLSAGARIHHTTF